MATLNLTVSSETGAKMFRLDTAKASPLTMAGGKTGADITDQVLIDELPQTIKGLDDGSVSYDVALSFLAEMHRRGLIHGNDFHVDLRSASRPVR